MQHVDVAAIEFDFDLTMAIVLMHPDGTIYHRYGTRPADDATRWTSIDGLCELLHATVPEHAAHERARGDGDVELPAWKPAIEQPALQHYLQDRQPPACIHCHTLHDAQQAFARASKTWRDEHKWVHPEPVRVGLVLDDAEQCIVDEVVVGSPAARAGVQPGDRLLRIGRQSSVLTIADVMWALHGLDAGATEVAATVLRGDQRRDVTLSLPDGWKRTTPTDYAWRPFKWGLSPAPGFGGPALTTAQKRALGIDDEVFAFRIQDLVTWGPNAHRGRAAQQAGLRKGDVVVSFAGKDDFESVAHFHAWVRLERSAGDEVEIVVLRDGERRTQRYRLPR